jgi:hypothetical protein
VTVRQALDGPSQNDDMQPPEGRMLLVSPHRDDAALSCAALIARTEPIDVLVVFSGSPDPPRQGDWDRLTGFPDSAASMSARVREDEAAFAGTPHRLRSLGLLEDQYISGARKQTDTCAICEAVTAWAVEGGGIVALPAGAGRRSGRLRLRIESWIGPWGGPLPHPDHEFLREAAAPCLAVREDTKLLLYEELPYLRGGGADRAVEQTAEALDLRVSSFTLPVDRSVKAARIAAYVSQLPHLMLDGTRLDDEAGMPEVERYWWLIRG